MGITGAAKLLVYVGLVEVNPENNWYYSLFDALTASKNKEVGEALPSLAIFLLISSLHL